MANNTPVGNLDFTSPVEAINALQRNPQVARLSLHGVITQTFSASTLYGFVIDTGTVTMTDYSSGAFIMRLTGPSSESYSFGAPLYLPPPGGGVVATASVSTLYATLWYK